MTALDIATRGATDVHRRDSTPYAALALIGLGGLFASLFLLCMALGGAIGDPTNGRLFDLLDGYRALFLLMACYAGLAFVTVLFVPRGAGEADTGPDAMPADIASTDP